MSAGYLREPASLFLLPALDAPSLARRFACEAVGDLLAEDDRRVLELLVSETVSNAVLHARSACRVVLFRDGHRVQVQVDDESPDLPHVKPTADEDGGWGLRLLDQLAHSWGAEPRPHGKCVWFRI